MSKKDNGLSADAALAVEDTPERQAERQSYFGGDVDDIDNEDLTGLDDGSDLEFTAPDESGDDDTKGKDDDSEDIADDDDGEPADDSDDDDSADEGDGDEADDDKAEDDKDEDDTDASDAEADEDEAEDEAEPVAKAKGIPKHRFDQVNERAKTAEAENTRLRAQIEAGKPPEEQDEPYDIRAGEKEYMDLLLDGDTEAALAKREEIDVAKEAKWKSETQAETRTNISTDAEQTELLSLSGEAEAMFDVFNPEHEEYNQDMLNKVMVFMKGYEATGEYSRGDAFVAGLADVVEMYDLMPEEDGEADPDPKPKPTGKKRHDAKRKSKLAKQAHTPVAGEGKGSGEAGAVAPDIETMTDEEIDALPEKTLARLRGDFV